MTFMLLYSCARNCSLSPKITAGGLILIYHFLLSTLKTERVVQCHPATPPTYVG